MAPHSDYRDLRRTEAENYARDFVPLIPAPLAADLIETAAPAPGEFVIDVACGTGVLTHLAAQRVGVHGKVVGIDLAPDMLRVAAATPVPSAAPIEWRAADAAALPIADDACDLVLCQLGVMFFPDRGAAVAEMRRVLSPGGRVAVNAPGAMPGLFDSMAAALGRHFGPGPAGFIRAVFALSPAELHRLFEDCQFRDVTVCTTTKTFRLPAPAEFLWQYLHVTPIAGLIAGADNDRRHAFEDEVVTHWQKFVDQGALTLELPITTVTARK
ncbi:methyltransferase domain-containing protein [Mycolicibacterium thermoresistibile]